jgi:hypothetical protein
MDFGIRDDSGLLTYTWKSVNMSSMVCDYITVRTTQLYRSCVMIFIQICNSFRLFQPSAGMNTGSQKEQKNGSGLCLQTVGLNYCNILGLIFIKRNNR